MSDIQANQAAEVLESWQNDIILFCKEALNMAPTPQQEQVLRSFQREGSFTSVKSGHGTGKTSSMCIAALWHTALFSPSKTIVTAPTYPQLRDSFIPEMALILSNSDPWFKEQINLNADRLSVKGREELQFMSARTARPGQESSLQGARADYTAYIVDECYGVTDKVFEVIQGAGTKGGIEYGGRKSVYRLCLGGNPTRSSGYAYDSHNKNRDLFRSITLNSEKSPLVGPDFLKRMERYKGTDIYRVRVLGEHPLIDSNTLIPRPLAEAAAKRVLSPSSYKFAPIILGVDTAWMGGDRSVVVLRQGINSTVLLSRQGIEPIDLAGEINQFWTRYGAHACFIDKGGPAAGGVINALQKWNRRPTGVDFGGSSQREDCYLKRMEMALSFKEWLEEGGKIDNNDELISEISGIEYDFNLKAQMVLESKDSIRQRTGFSCDLFDGHILTFAYPVYMPSTEEQLTQNLMQNMQCRNNPLVHALAASNARSNPLSRARESAGLR